MPFGVDVDVTSIFGTPRGAAMILEVEFAERSIVFSTLRARPGECALRRRLLSAAVE